MNIFKGKKYISIRTKLIISFLIVFTVLLLSVIVFIIMNLSFTRQYEQVTTQLILENKFSVVVPDLIDSYLNAISGASKSRYDEYYSKRAEILAVIKDLDATITKPESKTAYRSLRNFAMNLINICDDGLNESINGNAAKSMGIYKENIVVMKPYIVESTSKLTVSELEYAQNLQNSIHRTQRLILLMSTILFIVIVILTGLFVMHISNNITTPLIRLSDVAKDISGGNLERNVDADLMEINDEIGSLSSSVNGMLRNLNAELIAQETINKDLCNMERNLEEKNEELAEKDRALTQANEKLRALDKQKDEFISVAAHELKTPLTSIKGFSQVMQDDLVLSDIEKSRYYLDLINKNTNRLYDLVVDLVDSSRISIGQIKLNIENNDTNKIFNEIKENMSIVIANKGLTPEFIIDENVPNIMADCERTLQILRDLISNSLKFTEKGTISLHIHKAGDFVQFDVKDTGQGIPKENQGLIFSRFYQVDSSMTRKVGGSGLGLYICKGLVNNMGGKIWFNSEVGTGSVFSFTLPIAGGK